MYIYTFCDNITELRFLNNEIYLILKYSVRNCSVNETKILRNIIIEYNTSGSRFYIL